MTISAIAIFIAVLALLVAGFAKGISGMGLPVVATPVLTLLFDLQTAIAITIVPALLTDIIMLIRTPKNWGLIKNAASLMMFGMCGIVVGSYALVRIHPSILSAVLGVIILLFVGTSFFRRFSRDPVVNVKLIEHFFEIMPSKDKTSIVYQDGEHQPLQGSRQKEALEQIFQWLTPRL